MKSGLSHKRLRLSEEQVRRKAEVCQSLAKAYAKNGFTNEALLSFLDVFVTACVSLDEKFLFFLHELYLFATQAALDGDDKAKQILSELNGTLQELSNSK